MRKYKSKYLKPYIRRLKAGDLKHIKKGTGLPNIINECIINYARDYGEQLYVLTFAGNRQILCVSRNKNYLRKYIVAIDASNREFNRVKNMWKKTNQKIYADRTVAK